MDTRLDENKTELGVLVLSVLFQMLTNGNGLLDKVVKILGDLWGKSVSLKDTEKLGSCDVLYLSNTVRISQDHTNLRWGETLLGELANELRNLGRGNLQPAWWSSTIG